MKNIKKILLGFTVVLMLVCMLALAISATEYKIPVRAGWEEAGGPMGVIHDDTANGWKDSGYSDIDDHEKFKNGEKDVWVMIATNPLSDIKTDKYPNLAFGNGYLAYFNEYERKVVMVVTGSPHSQLSAYYKQETYESVLDRADNYAQYDVLFNMFALEYIFTQDAYKDIQVPGLNMTWAEYMSGTIKKNSVHDIAYPAVANDNTPTSTNSIFVMERAIADYFYDQYNADSSYSQALSNTTTELTGSSFKPTKDSQKRSRALLTGLVLWAQASGFDAQTVDALRVAAVADAKADIFKFYALKGSGGTFGWADGAENYFGDYGYVTAAFLINTNTSENVNVGCLGNYVDTLEIRRSPKYTGTGAFQTFGSVLNAFEETKTVLFDTTLNMLDPEDNTSYDRSYFVGMPSLTTLAHVSFDAAGGYDKKTVDFGVVDLSGFTATYDESGYQTFQICRDSSGITKAVWFKTLMSSTGVDYSGDIYTGAFIRATKLETIIIPANDESPLYKISANAFANTGLKKMIVLRSISEDLAIDPTAFSGCDSVTMYVLDKTSAANAVAALNTAGVKNVSVELFNPIQNPVSWNGTLVKMTDFETAAADKLAIRVQFTWNEKGEAAEANKAYTFKSLGIIASTAATYDHYLAQVETETGLTIPSLVAQEMLEASKDENSKVIQVLVTNADFTDGRRTFLKGYDSASGYYPFCLSLYGMTDDQITTEFYVAAYTEWYDEETGKTYYTFTTQDWVRDEVPKNSMSLYDATLGLVKQGKINSSDYESENDAQKYFYSVLEKGALTTDEFTSHSVSANPAYDQFLNADGSFTYWNVDYRKYEGGTTAVGWGYAPDAVEATPSSGVQFSILKDGAKYVVLLTKNENAAPEYNYAVPVSGISSSKKYYQPFHYMYGDMSNVSENAKANLTVYSPAITKAVYDTISTIIIDDGIVALSPDALSGNANITTMVFPESLVTINQYAISKNGGLTDIIWTGDPDAKAENKYNLTHLYDLRGCESVHEGSFLCDNYAAVNVVTQKGIKVDGQLAFNKTSSLSRYWSADGYSEYTMPAAGTIDVSKGTHGFIDKGYFNTDSKLINTIIVQGSLKSSPANESDDRDFAVYGANMSFNFVLVGADSNFTTYLKNFITGLHAGAKNQTYADSLSVNGVPVKTLWPELFQ